VIKVGKEELNRLVTEGMDPLYMKAFTSYSTTLFEHGSPFMGDNMDPLIQGN